MFKDRLGTICDHKWGTPPHEYGKTRTVCEAEDSDVGKFRFEICDMCKTHLYYIDDELKLAWKPQVQYVTSSD
jgi:hypothetical protein